MYVLQKSNDPYSYSQFVNGSSHIEKDASSIQLEFFDCFFFHFSCFVPVDVQKRIVKCEICL